jgi:hypothetical protein
MGATMKPKLNRFKPGDLIYFYDENFECIKEGHILNQMFSDGVYYEVDTGVFVPSLKRNVQWEMHFTEIAKTRKKLIEQLLPKVIDERKKVVSHSKRLLQRIAKFKKLQSEYENRIRSTQRKTEA